MMGFTPYQSMVLIPEGNPLTFADLLAKITAKFSPINIRVEAQGEREIFIRHDGWTLTAGLEDAPHVIVESREIAERLVSDEADKEVIRTASARIMTGGDPDPDMRYFNDYVYLLEVFEKIPGVYIHDLASGEVTRTD